MFGCYFREIHISDGIEKFSFDKPGRIILEESDRKGRIELETNGERITGHKVFDHGILVEWERHGQFLKEYKSSRLVDVLGHGRRERPLSFPYHPKSKRAIHGIVKRDDEKLFGLQGTCRTKYSRGKFCWQEFRYENRVLAYRVASTSKNVVLWYENGQKALDITVSGAIAKAAWAGDYDRYPHKGHIFFDFPRGFETAEHRKMLFSLDGDSSFVAYSRSGDLLHSGSFKNRQQSGDWILDRKQVFFINGIPVSKKLWEKKPEDLKITAVLRVKNAQMRAALMAKIGPKRIAKECKFKIIHQTKTGMMLMEFPIRVDDGNGGTESRMRILRVKCPTTKGFYYLGVPDFVWDGGKRTKLNKCEQARQWTFGVDNPRKRIKFEKET